MTEETPRRARTPAEVSQALIDEYLEESHRREQRMSGFDEDRDESVSLAFQVIRTARAFEHHLMVAAKDLTMTALQARFAWILSTAPFGVPVTTLWVELGMTQPGVHQMIQRMEARELVEVDVSSWDPRNNIVRLTARGLEEWAAVKERVRAVCEELSNGVGNPRVPEFQGDLKAVERLDERYPRFFSLRNPTRLPS